MVNKTPGHQMDKKLKGAMEKNEHLAGEFAQLYEKIYRFDRSLLGRVFFLIEKVYLLITLRPWGQTNYRQLVAEARAHAVEHGGFHGGKRSRFSLLVDVSSYFLRHPYSSFRLISWYRAKKLFNTVFFGDPAQATSWIGDRFPADDKAAAAPIIFEVSEELESAAFKFPEFSSVLVSVVVPVYNQYQSTVSCLKALHEHTHGVSFEVIIADDSSTDLTQSIDHRIQNITVVRAIKNQGFLKNCNSAVEHARGKYVVLLNNDTNVQPGWLDPLLEVMEGDRLVGLVGSKLLFGDGQLQEAGGIIWGDGTGWNYGRGNNPEAPEYNYVKEVDYISGACILFEKAVWDQLGGFDEHFCPAYYEDTDLAFRMREAGYKVIYQPESEVVHFEGVSNGSDLGQGVKKHQRINQELFYKKWKAVLGEQHYRNGESVFLARDRGRNKKTVVFIDHYVPFYDKDAGSRSTFLYVQSMLELGVNVKFLGANFYPHQPYTHVLQQMGVEVIYGERYARSWKAWFQENAQHIDVIYMHRPHITEDFIDFVVTLKHPRPKLIYFGHDLHYMRTEREARAVGDETILSKAEDWKRREYKIFSKVDKVLYPSQVEVDQIKSFAPAVDVSAIPLYLLDEPGEGVYEHEKRSDLLFVGGFGHPPNADAVIWFASEVMPTLIQEDPKICFHIVGSNVPGTIENLASENIIVHGYLTDNELESLYKTIKISVVPLRYGAGVKGKVLEALQAGVPIVTTSIGAEGLPCADLVMAIADDARSMADSVMDIYRDKSLANSFLEQYPKYINSHFSKQVINDVIQRDFIQ